MSDLPLNLIPGEWWTPYHLPDVRNLLVLANIPGYIKRDLFITWARVAGVQLTQDDVLLVMSSAPEPEQRR